LNSRFKETLIVYGMTIIITISSAIFFAINGYPLVRTATETLDTIAPPLYMIPIFIPFGILLGEVLFLLLNNKEDGLSFLILFFEVLITGFLSFIRYLVNIPVSGHTLILTFFLLHETINNRSKFPTRIIFGLTIFIITLIYKIFLWNDPFTFFSGIIIGFVIWLPGFLFRLRKSLRSNFHSRNYF